MGKFEKSVAVSGMMATLLGVLLASGVLPNHEVLFWFLIYAQILTLGLVIVACVDLFKRGIEGALLWAILIIATGSVAATAYCFMIGFKPRPDRRAALQKRRARRAARREKAGPPDDQRVQSDAAIRSDGGEDRER